MLESALRKMTKIELFDRNMHEIKIEILLDYVDAFEMVGNLKCGYQIRQTNIRF